MEKYNNSDNKDLNRSKDLKNSNINNREGQLNMGKEKQEFPDRKQF